MRHGEIDHRMQRRALLRQVRSGEVSRASVCDAHRELLRAGRHIGSEVDEACPVCDGDGLRLVTYVFTGRAAKSRGEGGSAVPASKLEATIEKHGDVRIYEVEVCVDCHWHHLLVSYWRRKQGRAVRTRTTSG